MTVAAPTVRAPSAASAHAFAFVAARRRDAELFGREAAELLPDADAVTATLTDAFRRLSDPAYLEGQQIVAPGIGPLLGVRWPLHAAVARGFRRETRRDPSSSLLLLADRLYREEPLELRWFAFGLLEHTLPPDPERSWQLLRRAAREAGDWITVDTLARPYGLGILLEHYRWSELEQLAFSPSRWERRLVGSTIATIPHVDRRRGRTPDVVERALPLLAELLGDADPDVQKALAWAYRTLAQIAPEQTSRALEAEAGTAAEHGDGHRAWVVRDALVKLDTRLAATLRARLAGIRKRPHAPSTSRAAMTASRFTDSGAMHLAVGGLPDQTNVR